MLHIMLNNHLYNLTRAGKSKSLIRWKRREKAEKGGKGKFDLQLDFWQNSTSLMKMS